MVTMGYHVPLDVCFGDQLAGFVTLGNLCIGVGTRFRRDSPVELWGTL